MIMTANVKRDNFDPIDYSNQYLVLINIPSFGNILSLTFSYLI